MFKLIFLTNKQKKATIASLIVKFHDIQTAGFWNLVQTRPSLLPRSSGYEAGTLEGRLQEIPN